MNKTAFLATLVLSCIIVVSGSVIDEHEYNFVGGFEKATPEEIEEVVKILKENVNLIVDHDRQPNPMRLVGFFSMNLNVNPSTNAHVHSLQIGCNQKSIQTGRSRIAISR